MAGTILAFAGGVAAWSLSWFNGSPQVPMMQLDHVAELRPLLSPNASIYLPGSEGFAAATDRWTRWKNPAFEVVVEVTTEEDVSNTIRYANEHGRPFLAVSGGHGGTMHLANVENGVGIWMKKFKSVELPEDGHSATIEGGVISKDLVDALWERGKQTVTGACECTGAIPPALGGGHGWLQGHHGLLADQIILARLVLANGSAVTVSTTSHPDLFWALRGAGHNFGIVTSMEYRVYDRTPENEKWSLEFLIFQETELENVLQKLNAMMEKFKDVVETCALPIIILVFLYQGQVVPPEYTTPFADLYPISHDKLSTDLPGLVAPLMLHNEGPGCQTGSSVLRFPFGGQRYNIEGLRKAYDILADLPQKLAQSWMIIEGYSMSGVQSINAEDSALPDRHNDLLMAAFMVFTPEDEALDQQATKYGKSMRDAVVNASGDGLTAYVNYAYGDESQEAIYVSEPWRLERLRKLKALYDPQGRFNFYNPILR